MTNRPATPVHHAALDVRFTLDVPAAIEAVLAPSLVDLAVEPDATRPAAVLELRERGAGFHDVWWGDECRAEGLDAASALYQALITIDEIAAEAAARTDTVLHGGGIEVHGHGVALVGRSGAGKTTLTTAAALAGHGFVADEICAIGPHGALRPFHRPVGLRAGGAARLGIDVPDDPLVRWTYPVRIGSIPGARRCGPVPLRLVALVDRRPGRGAIRRVEPSVALARLADETLGAEGTERAMFRRLEHLVQAIAVVELGFEDIDDALALVSVEVRR